MVIGDRSRGSPRAEGEIGRDFTWPLIGVAHLSDERTVELRESLGPSTTSPLD